MKTKAIISLFLNEFDKVTAVLEIRETSVKTKRANIDKKGESKGTKLHPVFPALEGDAKIIFLPVIVLSLSFFCPKMDQALHKQQEQHS